MTMYCSPADVRRQLNKTGTTGSGSDEALRVIIEGVSQAIDNYFNLRDGFVATPAIARQYPGSGKRWVRIDPCVEISLVEVKTSQTSSYTAWASTDWVAFTGEANDPEFNRLPYTALMVDPAGDKSLFYSGSSIGERGFSPSGEPAVISVPMLRVTAK